MLKAMLQMHDVLILDALLVLFHSGRRQALDGLPRGGQAQPHHHMRRPPRTSSRAREAFHSLLGLKRTKVSDKS